MSERQRFCLRGHDTFLVGRDSTYRCRACKREAGKAAAKAREAEVWAARAEDAAKQMEELRRLNAEFDRRRERLNRGGAA